MDSVIDNKGLSILSITKDKIAGSHRIFLSQDFKVLVQFAISNSYTNLSIEHLSKVSAIAMLQVAEDKVYGPERQGYINSLTQADFSNFKDTLRYNAHIKSVEYAKEVLDTGVRDIEIIADALHRGYISVAKKFVENPYQFKNAQRLRENGRLDMLLFSVNKLVKNTYCTLEDNSVEKKMYKVVANILVETYETARPN